MAVKRVCLLTGASGTLGTAFCRAHAADYAIVAVYQSRVPEATSQLQRLVDPLAPESTLPENEHPIYAVRADLTNEVELRHVVEIALARFDRIDVLMNAAGRVACASMLDDPRLLESALPQFHLNVVVPLRLAVQVAQRFWRDRPEENARYNRNVIHVSSTSGLHVYPDRGQGVYSSTKAALNYLSCHMADEFRAIGVRVNALAPTSFPSVVPVDRVVEALVGLDRGRESGKILAVDADGEKFAY